MKTKKENSLNSPIFILDKEIARKFAREVEKLSDEQAGKFIKSVWRFANNEEVELEPSFRELFEELILHGLIDTAPERENMSALDRAIAYHDDRDKARFNSLFDHNQK